MADDLRSSWADQWDLSRRYNFNHGSLGATPRNVLQRQEVLSRALNAKREEFIREGGYDEIEGARKDAARFVGAQAEDFVLTVNVTESINSVLLSLPLGEGDEVLVTSHIYSSYPALFHELARRRGFRIVSADIPYRHENDEQIIAPLIAAVTSRTRLAIIEHISSPTAIVFPVRDMVLALREKGVETFVDGAHAPGQVDVNVDAIGAAYYGGNCHKWMCAPLSSGFLHVQPAFQEGIFPAIGSAYSTIEHSFTERFSWQGVTDFVPRLMIPETIKMMADMHPEGWQGIRARNHRLALAARAMICGKLDIIPPVTDERIGAMFTIPLPPLVFSDEELQKPPFSRGYDYMVERFGFGVFFSTHGDEYLARVSCHLYNSLDDYAVLATGLETFIKDHT